jgi:predicted RNA-binding Zn-ribbon protein involved in translation (DUF1610 family)
MIDERLVLDANAVAGDLEELFGIDLTVVVHRCAHCGNLGHVGTLLAFTHGPGTVLRCSICREVVMRYVLSPSGARIDLRGAAELRFSGS